MKEKLRKKGLRPHVYALVPWPQSQGYDGRGGCVRPDPLSDREGRYGNLDAALLVPETVLGRWVREQEAFLRFSFPDSQEHESAKGTLSGYDGDLFVPEDGCGRRERLTVYRTVRIDFEYDPAKVCAGDAARVAAELALGESRTGLRSEGTRLTGLSDCGPAGSLQFNGRQPKTAKKCHHST